jgi:hypothetical protein
VQRRKPAHQLDDAGVAGQPAEQGLAGGHSALRDRPLPGRHTPAAEQNHRSPGGLARRSPPPAGAAQRRRPHVTLRRRHKSCMTHVSRLICAGVGSMPITTLAVQIWAFCAP